MCFAVIKRVVLLVQTGRSDS